MVKAFPVYFNNALPQFNTDLRVFKVEMIKKLNCVLSKRATRPYIYESTSANACVRIYE